MIQMLEFAFLVPAVTYSHLAFIGRATIASLGPQKQSLMQIGH
jgi:hypothetical protein